jgi:hypothetical protein
MYMFSNGPIFFGLGARRNSLMYRKTRESVNSGLKAGVEVTVDAELGCSTTDCAIDELSVSSKLSIPPVCGLSIRENALGVNPKRPGEPGLNQKRYTIPHDHRL